MTMHSGSRSGEPSRVIQGRSKRPASSAVGGNPSTPAPQVGLPTPMVDLVDQVKRLELRVHALEQAALKKGGHRGT